MPVSRTAPIVALALTLSLAACGDVHDPLATEVSASPPTTAAEMSHPHVTLGPATRIDRADYDLWQRTLWLQAVARTQTWERAVASSRRPGARSSVARNGVTRSPSPVQPIGSVSSVMECIKAHESGNYDESSHPGSGSGAFQYTPGTWRHWSAAAGYPGYRYAYQAPANVQDAVTAFTLTHGGAHNWDPRYGDDPCTTGLP